MMVGSWRALARGLVFAASLVVPGLALAQAQAQPQGDGAPAAAPFTFQGNNDPAWFCEGDVGVAIVGLRENHAGALFGKRR